MLAAAAAAAMEVLPVLDPLIKPKQGLWYSLTPTGSAPCESVGHTCTFIKSEEGGKGRILIVGGANPSGSFSHSQIINLDNHEWDIPDWEGLEARYEHCSFVPESYPQSLWVFGGAQQSGNHGSIQNIQLKDSGTQWKDVSVKGTPPCPRTYHTNSSCLGDRMYVFSGGEAGATPVSDQKLHVFDAVTSTWSQPETQGRHPPARHGHIIVAVGSKIYIHGGMAGDKFHNDIYSLDTGSMKWETVRAKGDIPPGVAAHSAVVLGKNIYIFGGMTADGASNSMYRFNTDKSRWVLIKFEGDMPSNRLDHSMCLLPWKVCDVKKEDEGQANSSAATETTHLAFVFGGMDTEGVIHNDCLLAAKLLLVADLVLQRVGIALQLIAGIDPLLQLLVLISKALSVVHHALDILRCQTVLVVCDGDLVLVACALVLSSNTQNTVDIDLKGDFNLRYTARGRGDASKHSSLHSSSISHSLIRVDAPRGLFAIEELLHQLLDFGNTGGASDQDNLINLLKLGTGQGLREVFSLKEGLNLNAGLVLGGQSSLCLLDLTTQLLHGTVVFAHIFAGLLLVQLDEVLHDTLVKVFTSQTSDGTSILGGLALGIIEVGGDSDHSMSDLKKKG
ncbi:hypothetical protein INR49_008890 [Caranx melampygus]|nr:hypothetical protein INR49_008890 [Caranx melampygus]